MHLFLPILVAMVVPQAQDPWSGMHLGDRVDVTLQDGSHLEGTLSSLPRDPRTLPSSIDFSTAREITLDVSLATPGLHGSLTLPKTEIRDVRLLAPLDSAQLKRAREAQEKQDSQSARDEADRKARERSRTEAARREREDLLRQEVLALVVARLAKEQEDLEKGMELLKRFPPRDWGPERLQQIARRGMAFLPVTPDEVAFADPEVQRLWHLALKATEREASAE